MILTNNEYASEQGWRIMLPEGWQPMALSRSDGADLNGGAAPLVFWSGQDPSLSITWTRSLRPIRQEAFTLWCTATMLAGPLGSKEAERATAAVCPVIGDIVEASVVRLPDGNKAVELIDEVSQDGAVTKQGIHLILPVKSDEPGPLYMQRLMFYAEPGRFKHMLAQVRQCLRSFHYI